MVLRFKIQIQIITKFLHQDLGKKIKVVVNFVDGFGLHEKISSDEIKIEIPVKNVILIQELAIEMFLKMHIVKLF